MAKFNKSTTYLLPIFLKHLELEFSLSTEFVNNNLLKELIQTYIFFDKKRYFILEVNKNVNSLVFLEVIKESCIFAKHMSSDDAIAIFLETPDDCEDTVDKFVEGRYSKICEADKQCILHFVSEVFNDNVREIVESILYKDEDYIKYLKEELGLTHFGKDWECGSKINIKDETYEHSTEETTTEEADTTV